MSKQSSVMEDLFYGTEAQKLAARRPSFVTEHAKIYQRGLSYLPRSPE